MLPDGNGVSPPGPSVGVELDARHGSQPNSDRRAIATRRRRRTDESYTPPVTAALHSRAKCRSCNRCYSVAPIFFGSERKGSVRVEHSGPSQAIYDIHWWSRGKWRCGIDGLAHGDTNEVQFFLGKTNEKQCRTRVAIYPSNKA
jgi:hypothetical protein